MERYGSIVYGTEKELKQLKLPTVDIKTEVLKIIEFEDKWLLDCNSHNENTRIAFDSMKSKIKAIPSAEPKTGHWIEKDGFDGDVYYDCSECGESWATIEGTPWDNEWKYCPSCGCRMVEPQERSEE